MTYLREPITPASIGGISLGANLRSVRRALGGPISTKNGRDLTIWEYPGLTVLSQHGVVDSLIARGIYAGIERHGLRIGMWWREVAGLPLQLYFDGDLRVWRLPEEPALQVTVGRPLRSGEQADEGWTEEWYELIDEERAFVAEIAVGR